MRSLYHKDYKSGRRQLLVWCVDATDGITPETGEAGGQPQISKNGAALTNTAATLVALDATKGLYLVTLTTAELDTLGVLRLVYKSAATAVFDMEFEVVPSPHLHDGTAQAGTSGTITLDTGASASDTAYDNGVVYIYDGLGAGQMRGIAAYVGATKVVTTDRNWTVNPDATSKFVIFPSPKPLESTDFADAILNRNIKGGSSSGRLVKQVFQLMRNRVALSSITGTTATMSVYDDDDTTVLFTFNVTLASGTNPITGIDPA